MKPYIPRQLDEAELTPVQFRIYAHLSRRANSDGKCWPSAESIAKACKISRDSVWPALAELVRRGLLRRERGFRNSNIYTLVYPEGGNEGPTQGIESAESEGLHQAEKEGLQSAPTFRRQLAEKEGRKGISMEGSPNKVNQMSVSKVRNADVEAIYSLYPRKVDGAKGRAAIANALKQKTRAELIEATMAYAKAVDTWPSDQKGFIPYPATWFNGRRYDDDPHEWEPKFQKQAYSSHPVERERPPRP